MRLVDYMLKVQEKVLAYEVIFTLMIMFMYAHLGSGSALPVFDSTENLGKKGMNHGNNGVD
jgi:hypothetical protein